MKDQSDIVEEVVDEVVQTYHGGFNRAIQNYSQILRLFSESTQSIGKLKVDLGNAKKVISARNKQLHQLWYRSMTLRHIISLLDQIENIAQVCFHHPTLLIVSLKRKYLPLNNVFSNKLILSCDYSFVSGSSSY